jgi:broad specificity phosphatase PhoE
MRCLPKQFTAPAMPSPRTRNPQATRAGRDVQQPEKAPLTRLREVAAPPAASAVRGRDERELSGYGAHMRDAGKAELWLVRHAQSEGNVADDAARGARAERLELDIRDPDVPLSAVGKEQALALGRSWQGREPGRRPTRLLSSPYERATQTALLAVDAAGWDLRVEPDERLRERDLGMLDGYTRYGIEARFPEEAERRAWLGKFYYRPPGGESWADVAGRVRAVLEAHGPAAGERLLVVTHQAVLMLFRYVLEVLDEQQVLEIDRTESLANTSVTIYTGEPDLMRLQTVGDVGHLDPIPTPLTEED